MSDTVELWKMHEVLADIETNQREFVRTRSLRKKYQLCLANEPLFALLGVAFPPMQVPRGPVGWWMRRGLPRWLA